MLILMKLRKHFHCFSFYFPSTFPLLSFYFPSTLPLLPVYQLSAITLQVSDVCFSSSSVFVPMVGMSCSHGGNVLFPWWEQLVQMQLLRWTKGGGKVEARQKESRRKIEGKQRQSRCKILYKHLINRNLRRICRGKPCFNNHSSYTIGHRIKVLRLTFCPQTNLNG